MLELPLALLRDRWTASCAGAAARSCGRRRRSRMSSCAACAMRLPTSTRASAGVFFSKQVALPFLRFRMLRHGYLGSPVYWREHRYVGASILSLALLVRLAETLLPHQKSAKGLWIVNGPRETAGHCHLLCPW